MSTSHMIFNSRESGQHLLDSLKVLNIQINLFLYLRHDECKMFSIIDCRAGEATEY